MSLKALVLHSGGLDSTVCLLLALEQGRDVISLGVDYGQRHSIELEYARSQCSRKNIPRKIIRVEWDKPPLSIPTDRKVDEIGREISPAFLPGRNVVFLALACAEAVGLGANEVWTGVNAVDFSGYPDCTPRFVDAFRRMIVEAIPSGPSIVAPLLSMSKPKIARQAYRLGLREGDTWCCYQPVMVRRGVEPCGRCDACVLHKHAWEVALGEMGSVEH